MGEHPHRDLLLDLALGQLAGPQRDEVLAHVADCTPCRNDLDELTAAVETVLPAVPRTEPRAGFATRVLQQIAAQAPHEDVDHAGRPGPDQRRGRPVWLAVAAAAVLGLGAGAGLTAALIERPEGAPTTEHPVASQGAPLLTADGSPVGFVARSWSAGEPVLVVDISGGEPGRSYLCRLGLRDGGTEDVGRWSLSPDRVNSWVVPDPGADTVELISDSGRTWSSATL